MVWHFVRHPVFINWLLNSEVSSVIILYINFILPAYKYQILTLEAYKEQSSKFVAFIV